MGDRRPDDSSDKLFVGSSARARKPSGLKPTRAYSDAPLSVRNLDDNEFLAERQLGVLFTNVLLREQLIPLKNFVETRQDVEQLDPVEFKELFEVLHKPISGPMWQIRQWRFRDSPTCYIFKGWRQNKIPEPTNAVLDDAYGMVYDVFRNVEQGEPATIPMEIIRILSDALEWQYNFIESEIDPHLKRVWVENEIARYEQWEGENGALPGRLDPHFVDEKLKSLRMYQEKFRKTTEGVMEYRHTPRPSMN
jgi:hypothetical protein